MKKDENFWEQYHQQINDALDDLKTKGRRHKQIPNILTVLRLTAPLFILPAALLGNIGFVIGATIFFGLTDLADGFIARKWNLKSKLGADLDAFADKMFAGTLLLAASVTNPALLINVGLEMAIAGININQKAKGYETGSTLMGKIKTFALFPLAGAGIISALNPVPLLVGTLALTTTALQALTIKSYLKKYNFKTKKEIKEELTNINIELDTYESQEETKEKEKKLQLETTIPKQEKLEVDELKDMRDYLINENNPQSSKEKPKVYQKQ